MRNTIPSYQAFRAASVDILMNQYLLGFTADLITSALPQKYTMAEKHALKMLLGNFKKKYWKIPQAEELTKNKSLSMTFDYFMLMQNKSEYYLSRLERVENGTRENLDVWPIVFNFKMMMQLIGSQIKYPGIIGFEFPYLKAALYLADIKQTLLSLTYLKFEQDQFLTQWQLKLNRALESIEGCYALFDDIIEFLDELNDNLVEI